MEDRGLAASTIDRRLFTAEQYDRDHAALAVFLGLNGLRVFVSDAANHRDEAPGGTAPLPTDLTEDQLASAPGIASVDELLINDLTDAEDDAFAVAINE